MAPRGEEQTGKYPVDRVDAYVWMYLRSNYPYNTRQFGTQDTVFLT